VSVISTVLDGAVDVIKVNPLGITIAGAIIFQVYGVQIYNSQKKSPAMITCISKQCCSSILFPNLLHTMES